MRSLTEPNVNAVRTAPALPDAAAIPCAVARTLVGKTSTGSRNVVQFGPTLRTNCEIVKIAIKPPVDVMSVTPAQMAYSTAASALKTNCWRTRPMRSGRKIPT